MSQVLQWKNLCILPVGKVTANKVNEELESFGNTIQEALTQHFDQICHLVSISGHQSSSSYSSHCSQQSRNTTEGDFLIDMP